MKRYSVIFILCAGSLTTAAHAQTAQTLKFWNLTSETITELKLAEPGTNKWGKNQTLNDKDKTVEADERLKLSDVKPGTWDVSMKDKKGRKCVLRNVTLSGTDAYAFSISEDDVKKCSRK
ncbi:hypothetical protein ACCD06_19835 [Azospirillum sp. CT11-132]|uniref:hypothetical protein n=1 Tax=Azospirillum sp. CT11-132 TaxID=3396317 RepID=UPI0039A612D5